MIPNINRKNQPAGSQEGKGRGALIIGEEGNRKVGDILRLWPQIDNARIKANWVKKA